MVTWNPDSEIVSRIEKVRSQVAQMVLVDNGSQGACIAQFRQLQRDHGVHLIVNPRNQGVAHALNEGARWAAQHAYRWILALDQDTIVAPDMLAVLVAVYQGFPDPHRLAAIGSNYTSSVSGKSAAKEQGCGQASGREVKVVIASGSLIPLSVLGDIGGFREEFFADCVDLEYCLRARSRGFRIAMTYKPIMQHSIGNVTEHRLPWRPTGTSNHSPWRRYCMTRNMLILAREYLGSEPAWVLATLWSRAKSMVLICFFEKQRFRKISYSLLGVVDGIRGKMTRFA